MSTPPLLVHRRQAFLATSAGHPWQVMRVADEVWGRIQPIERPAFTACFFALVLAGRGVCTCDGTAADLLPGHVFAMFGGRDYRIHIAEDLHLRLLVAGGRELERACLALNPQPPALWQPPRPASIEALFSELLEVVEEGGPQVPEIGAGTLRLLIALLHHAPRRQPSGGAAATFAACRETIVREALTIATVQQAAERCGIDRSYLCRLFTDHAGEAPGRLLLRLKMEHATRQLSAGSSITDTAKVCGFSSGDVFSRAFRRHFGQTPERWRRLLD